MTEKRRPQLAYSELQPAVLDEEGRRAKAGKIAAVVEHFLGVESLKGLRLLDLGCSAGLVCDELRKRGADVLGIDIDVPGLAKAHQRFGDRISFLCAAGERLPVADGSIDVVVFNHVYEHVVDPVSVVAEVRRVLSPEGIGYFGLANRLGVIEPHYGLPFLSWLPRRLAHQYVRATGRATHYHERFFTRPGLRRLLRSFDVWDYTIPVLAEPERFEAGDVVPPALARVPPGVLRAAIGLIPTYLWIGSPSPRRPLGPNLRTPPVHL